MDEQMKVKLTAVKELEKHLSKRQVEPQVRKPAAKERWRHLNTGQMARIMAFSENWVMLRFKSCAPWCTHWNDFKKNYERVT